MTTHPDPDPDPTTTLTEAEREALVEALRHDRCEYGCAMTYTDETVRHDLAPAVERIKADAYAVGFAAQPSQDDQARESDRDALTEAERAAVHRAETEFLVVCGACDGGLPMGCACPTADYRATMLTLVETIARLAAQPPQDDRDPGCTCTAYTIRTDYGTGVEHEVDQSGCPVHEPPQDDPQSDEREAALDGPGWFWTRAEWAEWSNELAMLFTEDEAHGNPDGAQESVILDTFTAWAEERRRDTDTGLRERVEAVGANTGHYNAAQRALAGRVPHTEVGRILSDLRDAVNADYRAALAEPTPGAES